MYPKQIFILFIIILSLTINSQSFSCSKSTSDSFKCRLTTITPYRFIANSSNDSEIKVPSELSSQEMSHYFNINFLVVDNKIIHLNRL